MYVTQGRSNFSSFLNKEYIQLLPRRLDNNKKKMILFVGRIMQYV